MLVKAEHDDYQRNVTIIIQDNVPAPAQSNRNIAPQRLVCPSHLSGHSLYLAQIAPSIHRACIPSTSCPMLWPAKALTPHISSLTAQAVIISLCIHTSSLEDMQCLEPLQIIPKHPGAVAKHTPRSILREGVASIFYESGRKFQQSCGTQ